VAATAGETGTKMPATATETAVAKVRKRIFKTPKSLTNDDFIIL
jgi:hypothetical protein